MSREPSGVPSADRAGPVVEQHNLVMRLYQDESDYGRMRRLLSEDLGHRGLPVYCSLGDLDWWRCAADGPHAMRRVPLWFREGALVAFVWPEGNQVEIVTHARHPDTLAIVLEWVQDTYAPSRPADMREPITIRSFTRDETRSGALRACGGRMTGFGSVVLARAIEAETHAPRPPKGYTFLPVMDEALVEPRAAVQRAAFESDFMTAARQRQVMASPTYQPELDVVLIGPDGAFVAFALLWLDEANRTGLFEPVGVAATHQGQGLGRVLLAEGLRRLGEKGAGTAVLQTGVDHAPMVGLAKACGFCEVDRQAVWQLPPIAPRLLARPCKSS